MKKKLAIAMVTTALGAALVGAGSFAIFTDSATNTSNTFTAGTLDINVANETAYTGTINNLAPGDTGTQTFTVKNDGSLDLKYQVTSTLSSGANTLVQGSATKDLNFLIEKQNADGTWSTVTPNNGAWITMASSTSQNYRVTYTLPLAADNAYQGKSSNYQVTFSAQQLRNNP